MKIHVYAICKNESKFCRRFMHAVRDADGVFVLDTGSTDDSVALLKAEGATVETEVFSPFRFDTARNQSLRLAGEADLYVCLDLDEVPEADWRAALERAANQNPQANRFSYRYVWSKNPDGSDGVVFWSDKIHKKGFYWRTPVHEVLVPERGVQNNIANVYGLQITHYPDNKKSRASYLPLLELAASENPSDDRTAHYLGREYMFAKRYKDAIRELKRHLALPSAVWKDERAASMRYISSCCSALGDKTEAVAWALRAVAESADTREPYLRLARAFYESGNHAGVLYACTTALSITHRKLSYITEPDAWGAPLHDLLSIAYYHFGQYKKAAEEARTALSFGHDDRIAANLKLFENK